MFDKKVFLSSLITLISLATISCYAAYPGGYGYAGSGALYYSNSGAYYDYPEYHYQYSRYSRFHHKHRYRYGHNRFHNEPSKFHGSAHVKDPWISNRRHGNLHHGIESSHRRGHQESWNSHSHGQDGRSRRK